MGGRHAHHNCRVRHRVVPSATQGKQWHRRGDLRVGVHRTPSYMFHSISRMSRRLILGAYCLVVRGISAHNEGILGKQPDASIVVHDARAEFPLYSISEPSNVLNVCLSALSQHFVSALCLDGQGRKKWRLIIDLRPLNVH